MIYLAQIRVTLRPSILDPQGKAAHHALGQLGFSNVEEVRMGKYIEIRVEAESAGEARTVAESVCDKLLANPVMEDFAVDIIEPATEPA